MKKVLKALITTPNEWYNSFGNPRELLLIGIIMIATGFVDTLEGLFAVLSVIGLWRISYLNKKLQAWLNS